MYPAYQYRAQNPVIDYRNRSHHSFIIDPKAHEFLVEYARRFTNIEIPREAHKPANLSATQACRVGKAMLTHERLEKRLCPSDQKPDEARPRNPNRDYFRIDQRRQIIMGMKSQIPLSTIDALWRITDLLLLGGNVKILKCYTPYDTRNIYIPRGTNP